MPIRLDFGTVIETTSFSAGEPVSVKQTIEESVRVDGIVEALTVIGDSLKKMGDTDNHKMTFEVIASHTNEPTRIVRRYQIERSVS